MTGLLALAEPATLLAAWEHVWAQDGADGWRSPSVVRFSEDWQANLERISRRLLDRTYQVGRLTPVPIPKDDGQFRTLLIGNAADRVVERALAVLIAPLIDQHLEHASFAYRAGLGVGDAIRRIVELRDWGLGWVLRTDIDDCFGSIDHTLAVEAVRPWIADTEVVGLIEQFLAPHRRPRGHWDGLPQGGSLSPMLANAVLNRVDRSMLTGGFQIVRYSDDIAIPTASRAEAANAKEVLVSELDKLGLRIGEEDTQIIDFATGFAFLGEDFNGRYPPSAGHPVAEVRRRTLYVGHQGAYISMRRGRVVVSRRRSELLSLPASHVGRIVTSGSVGLSAGLRGWALANGVDAVFLSRRGSYQGALTGPKSAAIERRRKQLEATSRPESCQAIGVAIVEAKLRNQRALLLRFNRRDKADAVGGAAHDIETMAEMAGRAETVDEINGIEGLGARRYFDAFGVLLPADVAWNGRNRRPPLDVANAALSYGYAILEGEVTAAVRIAGLDPTAGFLHRDHHRRPSLVLDLMEEFRPIVVDAVVLELFRRRSLTEASGRTEQGRSGVLLTEAGRKALVSAIEERLLTVSKHLHTDRRASRRRQIQLQAIQMAQCIDRDEFDYQPVRWR